MITAVKQLRLTNTNVFVTGAGVLQVGNNQVVYQSQTGNFAITSGNNYFSGVQSITGSGIFYANGSGQTPLTIHAWNSGTTTNGFATIWANSGSTSGGTNIIAAVDALGNISGNTFSGQNFIINGNAVVTTNQTGNFISNGQTGALFSSFVNVSQTGNFISNGQTGIFATYTQLTGASGYLFSLINASSAGVSSINSTSGALTIAGSSGISVSTVGQTLTITNNTGVYASFVNTGSTGIFITQYQTGTYFAAATAFTTFTGNQLTFYTGVTTGFDNQFVSFPNNYIFSIAPKIYVTLEIATNSNILYDVNIQGRTTSGYTALFSDIVQETGVVLHTLATIN